MKRSFRVVGVALVLALMAIAPMLMAQETPAAATCCANSITGQMVPKLVKDCGMLGTGWVDSAGPCTPGETEPGWWDTLLEWADGQVLYTPDASKLAMLLGWIGAFLGVVQLIKKANEGSGPLGWLFKLALPKAARDWLAHGAGPVVLNSLITGGTMLYAALQSPGLTAGEVLRILIAVLGVDLVYKFLRGFKLPAWLGGFSFGGLFPKAAA
jgi:hypothetical protein